MNLILSQKSVNKNYLVSAPPKSIYKVLMFCFCASFLAGISYLGAINTKGGVFTPDWHVTFHGFDSSTQIEILQKITDCKSLEFSKKRLRWSLF